MSLSFPRSSKLVFQFWLHLWFTGHWDSISLNLDSFYHWSLQFASRNRIAVNHFPAENINCHKLRIYQSIFRECFASLIIYDFPQATGWLLRLALLQSKLIDHQSIDLGRQIREYATISVGDAKRLPLHRCPVRQLG